MGNEHFISDQKLLSKLSSDARAEFMDWIVALEKEVKARGFPYDLPLHQSTGLECWYGYFEEGASPEATLDEDLAYD